MKAVISTKNPMSWLAALAIVAAFCLSNQAVAQSMAQDAANSPVIATVNVTAQSDGLAEEARTGAYQQPEWVQYRRFATSRVHIQRNPWEVSVEQWWRGRYDNGEWKHRFQEEIEIGLPGRVQLDFYYDWVVENDKAEHLDVSGEIRWAPADWGVIPLNPALYLEYKIVDPSQGGDVIEPKILFGEELGGGWQWALNLVYERELAGEKAEEFSVTQALSKSLIDNKLSLGVEMAWKRETVAAGRGSPEQKLIAGPSVQWRPTTNSHLDLVGLVGCTKHSPDFEGWLVFGVNFGKVASLKSTHAPVSGRR
ncbi:MAG: transporter [Verrucomicrobiaceae bacterium]|nr:transporter [Verrucomicrobiaceae bacterium]